MGDFQHATLDVPFSMDTSTNIDQTTLQEVIEDQPWCLNVDKTITQNKVMIITTTKQLPQAPAWLDHSLPLLYEQHINDKINVTTLAHITPWRLDKPILTAVSTAYANALKQCTSANPMPMDNKKQTAKPPCTPKTCLVDINFDDKEFPTLQTQTTPQTQTQSTTEKVSATTSTGPSTPTTPPPTYDYKKELMHISNKIETTLKKQFKDVFTQLEHKLDNFIQQYTKQHE